MKKIATIIAAAITALMLVSCSESGIVYEPQTNKLPSNGNSWTVLVYMCASSAEAENGAYSDKLRQLMSVDYPENITVAVQTGGSGSWRIKGMYSDYMQRFEVGKDSLYLADQSVSADMGNYRTLSDFIGWGMTNYISDKYMLILVGTGGNCIDGMGYDGIHDGNSLNLEEISYAMSLASRKFDIVGIDASLMGSLETASALSTYADYLVAPQAVQSEDSWNYKDFMQYLCDNPSVSDEDICREICDTYYESCLANKTASGVAMSAVDMSKISALNQAFDGMAGDMLITTNSLQELAAVSKIMDTVHVYGGATAEEGYSNLIDLGDTAVKLRGQLGATADMLIEALNDAVVYRVCGENENHATGLSVYYPIEAENDALQQYMEVVTSGKYKEFLRKICINCFVDDPSGSENYTESWAWNTYNEDMQTLEYNSILDANSYELNIHGNMDMFKKVSMNVYKADRDGGYVFAGNYDRIDSDWDGGIFKDAFDGKLIKLCGKTVSPSLVRSYDEYELYSIPVLLNGIRSNIRVSRDKVTNKYTVIGAWRGLDENGAAQGGIKKVSFFDRITPVFSVYDEAHNKTEYKTGKLSVKLTGGAAEKTADNGSYIFEYELTDIYGMKRRGTPVSARFNSGEIYFD